MKIEAYLISLKNNKYNDIYLGLKKLHLLIIVVMQYTSYFLNTIYNRHTLLLNWEAWWPHG